MIGKVTIGRAWANRNCFVRRWSQDFCFLILAVNRFSMVEDF